MFSWMRLVRVMVVVCLVRLGAGSPCRAAITGQWDFNAGNLTATIGTALQYRGDTAGLTRFGTTTSLGIADINGQPAQVMQVPACSPTQGFLMPHGASPNGGGAFVNRF